MKRILLLCCIHTICSTPEQADTKTETPTPQQVVIEQTIIQTVINQQFIKPEKQPFQLFGEKLNAYLNNIDSKTFKEFFPQLPLRAKIMYMLTITPLQYEQFLERYTNEEWSNFWYKLSSDEQKHIPKTRVEQLELIRDGYYTYIEQHSSMLFSYFNPKAPYPSDIETFKKSFYDDDRASSTHNDFTPFIKSAKDIYLNNYMFKKRYELFNL